MSSPAYELALRLEALGVGVFGTSIHVGTEPEAPDECVTLYDTGGLEPDTDEMDIRRPTIMVKVRSLSYLTAYQRQEQIKALFFATPFLTATSRFSAVILASDFISVGQDDNKRHAFTANYRCMRTAL
jgi:hypothetical protein